jgi:hypothetical protein
VIDMLVKGKISTIDPDANSAEVILLEYDNAITAPVPFYNSHLSYSIGQFVVLAVFNDDFNDSIIM